MREKNNSIPVNPMANESGEGLAIERISFKNLRTVNKATANAFAEPKQPHRHDGHSFFLLEKGIIFIEIDFQKYTIKSPSVIYIHPNQVHRTTAAEKITVSSLSITNEKLHPAYLKLLEEITPAKPLRLKQETFRIIAETTSLCIQFAERKRNKLYHLLLRDSCNALVALVVSQYLEQSKSKDKLPRFETVANAFRKILEQNYTNAKRPSAYSQQLNLSTAYLNECVKNTTGYSVSYHIQQRVILEAKRLLSHSDKTVKQIAAALGYDDYPYFSRLFTKAAGTTALAFRNKNRD